MLTCRNLIANGGYLAHLVPVGTRKALCGHEPKNRGRMDRARWAYPVQPGGNVRQCSTCAAKALLANYKAKEASHGA